MRLRSFALTLFIAVSGLAVADTAQLESGPPEVRGDLILNAASGGLDVDLRSPFEMDALSAEVVVVTASTRVVATPSGDVAVDEGSRTDRFRLSDVAGEVTPCGPKPHVSVWVDDVETQIRAERPNGVLEFGDFAWTYASTIESESTFHRVIPDALLVTPGRAQVAGTWTLILSDAGIRGTSVDGPFSFCSKITSAPADPLGSSRRDTRTFVSARFDNGSASLSTGSGGLAKWTSEVSGQVARPRATGIVTTNEQTWLVRDESVVLGGVFSMAAASPASVIAGNDRSWTMTGRFEQVVIAGIPRLVVQNEIVPTAVTIGLIAAFLAARFLAGVLFSRIARRDSLLNETRQRILQIVRERPGVHLRALSRATGVPWAGALLYHLGVLQRADLIRLERHGKRVLVVPSGVEPTAAFALASRGEAGAVYDAVVSGCSTQAELQKCLGISIQLTSHHVRRLVAEGWLEERPGRPKRYFAARRVRRNGH